MVYVWTAVIGLVIGLAARMIVPGGRQLGIVMTAVLGVAGSLGAAWAGAELGWYGEGDRAGFIASVAGAVVVLVAVGRLKAGSI